MESSYPWIGDSAFPQGHAQSAAGQNQVHQRNGPAPKAQAHFRVPDGCNSRDAGGSKMDGTLREKWVIRSYPDRQPQRGRYVVWRYSRSSRGSLIGPATSWLPIEHGSRIVDTSEVYHRTTVRETQMATRFSCG